MIQIPSILDNDFYKFTMQNAVVKLFPRAQARYQFINRGRHSFPAGFGKALEAEIRKMAELGLSGREKLFLQITCPYLDSTYLDFLQGYRYDPSEVNVRQSGSDLQVSIAGYWYRTILWEVPILFLISELYYRFQGLPRISNQEVAAVALEKIRRYAQLGVTIADFGTRRRHSHEVQDITVQSLKESGGRTFIGTSNVFLAMRHQTKPIGTHAHEWFMFHAAKYGFKMANRLSLEHWAGVYRGDLGIALSDTYTSGVFFGQFDKMFAKLFDGVRQDSGDPVDFAKQAIQHYRRLGIDPMAKTVIFSDNLNFDKVKRIADFCEGKIGYSFGVGTNFTNDVGLKPLNIVLKMTEALPEGDVWTPVVKLSDERNKYTGETRMIELAKEILGIQEV